MRLLFASHLPGKPYLAQALTEAGYVVEVAQDLTEALLLAAGGGYEALVVELARLHGAPVGRMAQAAGGALLILIADQGGAASRTAALRDGADACFVRPVHFMEMEARLKALARLAPGGVGAQSLISLDAATRTAHFAGRSVILPAREYHLLEFMARRPGEVLSPTQILDQVWGGGGDARPELVRTNVARLRFKLAEAFGQPCVVTVRGHGYSFAPDMTGFSSG